MALRSTSADGWIILPPRLSRLAGVEFASKLWWLWALATCRVSCDAASVDLPAPLQPYAPYCSLCPTTCRVLPGACLTVPLQVSQWPPFRVADRPQERYRALSDSSARCIKLHPDPSRLGARAGTVKVLLAA